MWKKANCVYRLLNSFRSAQNETKLHEGTFKTIGIMWSIYLPLICST